MKNYRVTRAGIAILNYLRDYPQAEDTVAGIAQWWIGEEQEAVEKALVLLMQEGAIERRGDTYRARAAQYKLSDDEGSKIHQPLEQLIGYFQEQEND